MSIRTQIGEFCAFKEGIFYEETNFVFCIPYNAIHSVFILDNILIIQHRYGENRLNTGCKSDTILALMKQSLRTYMCFASK
jgi:alkyl hydroperoxide reductase subunit AhpC